MRIQRDTDLIICDARLRLVKPVMGVMSDAFLERHERIERLSASVTIEGCDHVVTAALCVHAPVALDVLNSHYIRSPNPMTIFKAAQRIFPHVGVCYAEATASD
jgi:hypothetical protein